MAKLTIELPYSYDQKDIAKWLAEYKLTHLKSHGNYWIKAGDALRSAKGVIARVVWDGRNEVGEPHIVIANNKLSIEEMMLQFENYPRAMAERINKGREILFTIPVSQVRDRSTIDIMADFGYPAAGYGCPYDEQEKDGVLTFKCSGNCD